MAAACLDGGSIRFDDLLFGVGQGTNGSTSS
jgi:hypothetical protein